MTIKDIYNKFQIPKNLELHMLRVGALANIITDNWNGGKIDKDSIIRAALIHDIAKPLIFDPNKQAQFGMSKNEIENLIKLQKYIKSNFGQDEHIALIEIAKYLECDSKIVDILDNSDWSNLSRLLDEKSLESLIQIYCDMRIGPKGILTIDDRLNELEQRQPAQDFKSFRKNGELLENLIKQNVKTELNSISNKILDSINNESILIEFKSE
jgi:5'-deoxynucleotidase YfbR-like HD superfamily hydrolase